MGRLALACFLVFGPGVVGCSPGSSTVTLGRDDLVVTMRLDDGTYDVARGGEVVFRRATADVLLDEGAGPRLHSFSGGCARARDGETAFLCEEAGLALRIEFTLPPGKRHLVVAFSVENRAAAPITVLRLAPLVVDAAAGGALLLGDDPREHRILENGRFVAFDSTAQLEAGDVPRFGLGAALPIPLRGNSVSNWNHVVADVAHPDRSLVAGWLGFERSVPTLGVAFDDAASVADAAGRRPFTGYAAENALLFHGKPLAPGQALAAEPLYLDPLPPDPLAALERYADEVAAALGVVPWPKRGAGHGVPNGWNSWSGGDSTGGYGHAIDEPLILANMEVVRRQLAPFGMDWFQVDDGWQVKNGDWSWRMPAFPEGGAGMAGKIAAAGFKPGLWIAPFLVDPDSSLAGTHPDWINLPEDGVVGSLAPNTRTLDLTNPDVLGFLDDTFTRFRADGWRWAKVDFTYWDLLGKIRHDPSQTAVEAFRAGWRAIRQALGPEVFLVGIAVMGPNIGVIDAMRTTLDNGPRWDEPSADDLLSTPRAMKGTVRTGSRRWFYQNRIWVNHEDLIYFRSWPAGVDGGAPPLSLEEARTFATWIGLGGGVVKLGDKLLDLAQHPDWIDIVRRLLPAWPDGARPLDVMLRDYPEEFALHVNAPAGEWDVIGLFHWGRNRDFSTNPPTALDESPRTHSLRCDDECLAFEFWSETFLGRAKAFSVTLDARRTKVIALRRVTGRPQLVGDNRQVTMGATDLGPFTWDEAGKTLAGTVVGAAGTLEAPFEHRLAFYVPTGFTFDHIELDGATAVSEVVGEVLKVRFSLPAGSSSATVGLRIFFR